MPHKQRLTISTKAVPLMAASESTSASTWFCGTSASTWFCGTSASSWFNGILQTQVLSTLEPTATTSQHSPPGAHETMPEKTASRHVFMKPFKLV